jgi:hypothetical protein
MLKSVQWQERNMHVELYPGTMGLAWLCIETLGSQHVDVGSWLEPVTLHGVSQDDIDCIIALAAEKDVTINYRII